jgi:hypothetical protein
VSEVILMCFSTGYIEQQASRMTNEIRSHSVYKFLGVGYFDGDSNHSHKPEYTHGPLEETRLISKIFLEDEDGTVYSVEPNMNGLKFAKGEISYSKYRKSQRKNDTTIFLSFFAMLGFFSVSLFLVSKLL